ncbi:MAG TPA: hypothetical protein VK076_00720 [Candidatus Sphingobacterium stercoripullorum]|nr:hypothetical protein [Candidatus Sphingobacterium stercoripullorum]
MVRQFISLVILFTLITACNSNKGDIESNTGDQKRDTLHTSVNTTNTAPESDSMTFKTTDIKMKITPFAIRKTHEFWIVLFTQFLMMETSPFSLVTGFGLKN